MRKRGQELVQECQNLVIEYLRHHSAGATNQQIAEETGLYLDVPNHKGYISWTVLEHLVVKGALEKIDQGKRGGLYRLKAQQTALGQESASLAPTRKIIDSANNPT